MTTVDNTPSIAKDQLRRIKRDLADPFDYLAKARTPARTPTFRLTPEAQARMETHTKVKQ